MPTDEEIKQRLILGILTGLGDLFALKVTSPPSLFLNRSNIFFFLIRKIWKTHTCLEQCQLSAYLFSNSPLLLLNTIAGKNCLGSHILIEGRDVNLFLKIFFFLKCILDISFKQYEFFSVASVLIFNFILINL